MLQCTDPDENFQETSPCPARQDTHTHAMATLPMCGVRRRSSGRFSEHEATDRGSRQAPFCARADVRTTPNGFPVMAHRTRKPMMSVRSVLSIHAARVPARVRGTQLLATHIHPSEEEMSPSFESTARREQEVAHFREEKRGKRRTGWGALRGHCVSQRHAW